MKMKFLIAGVLIAFVALLFTIWEKFYRDVPQPRWIGADQRSTFLYGAVDAERAQGIPYWIWLVLPRVFPEYMPGPGGYASLGMSWEETFEMPAGLAKKSIGYVRVTGNCALCHATSTTTSPEETPTVIVATSGHTTNTQPLLMFFVHCAQDPRFNANEILAEIDNAIKLSFLDRMIYRYVLIPRTREALADPPSVIFGPLLQAHVRNPHGERADQRMKELEAWMNTQRH
jgi:hypothetical protein